MSGWKEIQRALAAGAHLSGVIMCGSILDAVLLGAAQHEPRLLTLQQLVLRQEMGKSSNFRIRRWFIDAAHDVGVLELDVKKFSHSLRDFRNYIHPYEQKVSGFTLNEHTANVCFQVLKTALASVSGDR